jgi:hypothetical protein
MHNRKHTLDLAALLNALAIELQVELEILDFETPTVADHHSALMAAWRLAQAGVKASNVSIEAQRLSVTQRFNVKGTPGISLEFNLQFDRSFDMSLTRANVMVYGVTMANSKGWEFPQYLNPEKRCHEFTDVDVAMFTTIPALMASFVQGVWRFVFNDRYSSDWVHMSTLTMDFLKEKKDVRINGEHYTTLQAHHLDLLDHESGTTDLVGLAARLFLQSCPNNSDVCFVVGPTAEREPQYVLCVETDEM